MLIILVCNSRTKLEGYSEPTAVSTLLSYKNPLLFLCSIPVIFSCSLSRTWRPGGTGHGVRGWRTWCPLEEDIVSRGGRSVPVVTAERTCGPDRPVAVALPPAGRAVRHRSRVQPMPSVHHQDVNLRFTASHQDLVDAPITGNRAATSAHIRLRRGCSLL